MLEQGASGDGVRDRLGRTLGFSFACRRQPLRHHRRRRAGEHLGLVRLPPQFACSTPRGSSASRCALSSWSSSPTRCPGSTPCGMASTRRSGRWAAPSGGSSPGRGSAGDAGRRRAARPLVTAGSSHFTKAGTRAMVNASPEPFSNWVAESHRGRFALGLTALALSHPVVTSGHLPRAVCRDRPLGPSLCRGIRRRFLTPKGTTA